MNRRRMQVLYTGHVQGVGFRYQAKQLSTGFEVTGRVRNLPDGRVELVAEGEESELEAFRKAVRSSGLHGLIRDEDIQWSGPSGEFRDFAITS